MATKKVSTFSAYRSYQQITRTLLGVCITLGLICITLGVALVGILPLKEIRPMLIGISDESQQVVRIEPLKDNLKGINLLIEKLLMHYVKQRETIDGITESERFGEVANMTSTKLWNEFWNFMKSDNPKSPLKAFFDSYLRREVHVKRCLSLQATAKNTYRIEWTSIDRRHGEEVKRQDWITTLAITFEPQNVKVEDRYMNPLGLTVMHYTVSKKEDD